MFPVGHCVLQSRDQHTNIKLIARYASQLMISCKFVHAGEFEFQES